MVVNFKTRVRKEFASMPENFVVLVLTDPSDYAKTSAFVTKHLTNDLKMYGVYTSFNKPYEIVRKELQREGVDTKRLFFIDLITETSVGRVERTPQGLCLASPRNLTDFSIALSEVVKSLPEGKRFVLIDSLNTMMLYNHEYVVTQFLHYFAGRIKLWRINGVLLSTDGELNKRMLGQLSQFIDKVIFITRTTESDKATATRT